MMQPEAANKLRQIIDIPQNRGGPRLLSRFDTGRHLTVGLYLLDDAHVSAAGLDPHLIRQFGDGLLVIGQRNADFPKTLMDKACRLTGRDGGLGIAAQFSPQEAVWWSFIYGDLPAFLKAAEGDESMAQPMEMMAKVYENNSRLMMSGAAPLVRAKKIWGRAGVGEFRHG